MPWSGPQQHRPVEPVGLGPNVLEMMEKRWAAPD